MISANLLIHKVNQNLSIKVIAIQEKYKWQKLAKGEIHAVPGLGEGSPNGEDSPVLGQKSLHCPAPGCGEGSPNGEDSPILVAW